MFFSHQCANYDSSRFINCVITEEDIVCYIQGSCNWSEVMLLHILKTVSDLAQLQFHKTAVLHVLLHRHSLLNFNQLIKEHNPKQIHCKLGNLSIARSKQ